MPITDAFTGTNGTGLPTYSSNWTYTKGSGTNIAINNNAAHPNSSSAESCCERTETGFPAGHYAQGTFTAVLTGSTIGAAVRCQGSGSQDYYGYYASSTTSELFENDGATWTQLGSSAGGFAVNDTIRLTVSGSTLTPNKNGSTTGTPGAQTDATFSNGKPGVCAWNVATGLQFDSFECSDVSAGASLIPLPRTALHAVTRAAVF